MDTLFSAGFTMQPATMERAAELTGLIALRDQLEYPPELDYQPDYVVEDIEAEWRSMDLAADTCMILAPNGQLVGYLGVALDFFDAEHKQQFVGVQSFSGVHPAFVGRGIGTTLLHFADTWTRQHYPMDALRMIAWINPRNERARRLFTREGFLADQHSVIEMKVKLNDEPQPVSWPAGISVRTFRPGQDDTLVKSAIEEAFGGPFTHWDQVYTKRVNFDPTLWYLAWDGDQLAGALLGVPNPTLGWVDQLGVRPAWRTRGIGQALLQHAIRDFYRRGLRTVALSVGMNNRYGALHIYERAGMQVGSQVDRYSKPARI